MGIFDQLGEKITKASQDVAQSTKNLATTGKLNSQISEEEKRIEELYREIGKKYYEVFSTTPDPALEGYVTAVKESFARIADCQEKVKELKGVTSCPNCGSDVPFTSAFCNACGTRMPERKIVEAIPEGGLKCGNCGAIMPGGFKFCTSCGSPVEAPQAPVVENNFPVKICPDCGKELDTSAAFCLICGYKF